METFKDEKKVARSKQNKGKRNNTQTEPHIGEDNKKVRTDPDTVFQRKQKKYNCYDPKKEAMLEKLVLGDDADILENLKGDTDSETENEIEIKVESNEESDQKILLRDSDSSDIDQDENDSDDSGDAVDTSIKLKKSNENPAAWSDEDDDISIKDALDKQSRKLPNGRPEKTYNEVLQNKFAHVMGKPDWSKIDAKKETKSDDSDDEELLKHSNHLKQKKGRKSKIKSLPKDRIHIKILTDINQQTRKEGAYVNCVQFNDYYTIAMAGGNSGVISLFQVDGNENNKLHSLKLEYFPIHCARFLNEGTEILIGSNPSKKSNIIKNHCYSFDLMKGDKPIRIPLPHGITNMQKFEVSPNGQMIAIIGKCGEIHLLNSKTKELIEAKFKMNKSCKSIAFSPDNTKLFGFGESAEVYIWDLRNMNCMNIAIDDGAVNGSTIAISPNGQFLATGSKQGVVNIYNSQDVINMKVPVPIKRVFNLTTAITKLKFNHNTEILAMFSEEKSNSLKMLHLPSFQVFPNFPTYYTTMFNPLDIDFSPQSGYMALSNNRGFAYLYRLKHYENY